MGLSVASLNTWLAQSGMTNTTVGFFTALSVPYAFKFLFAPLLDHISFPFFSANFGKKRSVLFLIQPILVFCLVMLGLSNPTENIYIMAFWAFIVTFFAALHEIILDSYRISVLPESMQGIGSSSMLFGNRVGFLLGSGVTLFIVDYLCYGQSLCKDFINWHIVYCTIAPFVFVGGVAAVFLKEPDSASQNKETSNLPIFKRFILHPITEISKVNGWVLILCFAGLYRVCDAFIAPMINPFLLHLGFSLTEIAMVEKTFGVFAMIFGIFIGGIVVHRFGAIKALFFGGLMQMVSNFMFVVQASIGHNVLLLYFTIAAENACGSIANTALVSYLSLISSRFASSGSVYALLSSLTVANTLFLPIMSGFVVDSFGWVTLFNTSVALGLPALFCLLLIVLKSKKNEAPVC